MPSITASHARPAIRLRSSAAARSPAIRSASSGVKQKKPHKKIRIMLKVDGVESSLGALIRKILKHNAPHGFHTFC